MEILGILSRRGKRLQTTVLLLLGLAIPLQLRSKDIYLAVRSDHEAGKGTPDDPLDAGSMAKYDAILRRFKQDVTFHYAGGTYQTRGGAGVGPGVHHLGPGDGSAVVQLSPSANGGDIFASTTRTDDFQCDGLTLDCAANSLATWSAGTVASAISVQGSNVLIRNCKFIHFGTSAVGKECFPVFCFPTSGAFSGQTFSHVHVENCLFTEPATGNRDGCSVVYLGANGGITIEDFVIRNCRFIDFGSDFIYAHAMSAPLCEGNVVEDSGKAITVGWYVEPGSYGRNVDYPVVIRNNQFAGLSWALLVTFHSEGSFGPIAFQLNQVALSRRAGGKAVGVGFMGKISQHPALPELVVENNHFTFDPRESHSSAVDLSCSGMESVIDRVRVGRNTVSGTSSAERVIQVSRRAIAHVEASGNYFSEGPRPKSAGQSEGAQEQPRAGNVIPVKYLD